MAAYPYTYLASYMNPDFRATVVATAVREVNKAPGALRQRLDRAVRNANLQAPGYRPGKIPLNQVAKPLVMPLSRTSQLTPFSSNEELAYAVLSLWVNAKADLRAKVVAFLTEKGLPFSEDLKETGLEGELKVSEMEALAKELGAPSDVDTAAYDETALMLVCLLGRAPAPDEEVEELEAEEAEEADETAGTPAE